MQLSRRSMLSAIAGVLLLPVVRPQPPEVVSGRMFFHETIVGNGQIFVDCFFHKCNLSGPVTGLCSSMFNNCRGEFTAVEFECECAWHSAFGYQDLGLS